MATVDQPTPPNYGNLSAAQFLALPDWAVAAMNQLGPNGEQTDDTFEAMNNCIVALLYRLIRDNFAYLNEAWACRVDTPISDKIADLQTQLQSRATDNGGQALTTSLLTSFAVQLPSALFSCDGNTVDPISSGDIFLINVDPPTEDFAVYQIVNAKGGEGIGGDIVYGLNPTLNRYYYSSGKIVESVESNLIVSCNVTLDWPQDSSASSKIVLLKVADYLTTDETGATKRIQFEFGLQDSGAFDPSSHGTDRVLYLRYYDGSDVEQFAFAKTGGSPNRAVSIGYGREITLGFSRLENGATYDVAFYINGLRVSLDAGLATPSAGTSLDIRLHVGSNQLGANVVGGPINNVYYWSSGNTKSQAETDSILNSVYRIGAGYLTT